MSLHLLPIACDLVAIAVIAALYFRRHQRRDLLLAYVALNIGILSVTAMLTNASVGAGLGLGLFGILSIIRLRSEELSQSEIAYYFAALALGLLAGLDQAPTGVDIGLMAAVLAAVAVGDGLVSGRRTTNQQLLLDRAITDQPTLVGYVEELLGARVLSASVIRTDLVNDTTLVSVRSLASAHRVRGAGPTHNTGFPAQEVLR